MDHPHRFLEYSPTNRTTCHGKCKKSIPLGHLRYGTKTHVMEHDSITWRCVACVTEQQARNFVASAAAEGKSLRDFLTVPPSVAAGGDGPESGVVSTFVSYISALAAGEDGSALLADLRKHHEVAAEDGVKKRKYISGEMDSHWLDEQASSDPAMLKLFSKPDLAALAEHHGLSANGKKPDILKRLQAHYGKKVKI